MSQIWAARGAPHQAKIMILAQSDFVAANEDDKKLYIKFKITPLPGS